MCPRLRSTNKQFRFIRSFGCIKFVDLFRVRTLGSSCLLTRLENIFSFWTFDTRKNSLFYSLEENPGHWTIQHIHLVFRRIFLVLSTYIQPYSTGFNSCLCRWATVKIVDFWWKNCPGNGNTSWWFKYFNWKVKWVIFVDFFMSVVEQ